MNNAKKIGLTALAGSLVAFTSASAGELSVSGGAKLSYTNKSGNEDGAESSLGTHGSGWGMQHLMSLTGSGELDNGMTVSLLQQLQTDGSGASTSAITLDMGSMGTLTYQQGTGNIGMAKIDDVMPTAEEEVSNGVGILAEHSATSAAESGVKYEADMGGNGFNYSISPNDVITLEFGYSRGNIDTFNDDGGTTGTGASDDSGKSVHFTAAPMDGLTVYGGTGQDGSTDQDTVAAVYNVGPFSVGYQWTERDVEGANSGSVADSERNQFGIAMAINENLSVSVGQIETEIEGQANDEEIDGASIAYSMGGMALKAHTSKGENMGGAATNESEHTEVSISFAF
jgi:outer membrane protein OmpU